jgi:hypothetical protein
MLPQISTVHVERRTQRWMANGAIAPTHDFAIVAEGLHSCLTARPNASMLDIRISLYVTLSALGIPITPTNHRIFRWILEPLLLVLVRRRLADDATSIKIGHAAAARDEMKSIAEEFRELVGRAGVDTPSIDTLRRYLDATEPIADGSCIHPHQVAFRLDRIGSGGSRRRLFGVAVSIDQSKS